MFKIFCKILQHPKINPGSAPGHRFKSSYYKMKNNDNPSTQLPIAPMINKNQNINIETNISKKITGYVKADPFNTF